MAQKTLNSEPTKPVALRFGNFRFQTESATLFVDDRLVRIPRKSCELLGFLLENAGRVVTKDEIMESVWADTFVEESNLSHHIAVLRKALKGESEIIETVPRIGYRFVAPVTPLHVESAPREIEFESDSVALIGREQNISVLAGELRAGRRLLTLTGPGGVGKTSLAREVMHDCASDFSGRTFFVDLSEITEIADVAGTIAGTLGIGGDEIAPPYDRIARFLGDRATLLVLDNLEHLIDAGSDLEILLARCPRLAIIVTSRTRLNLRIETEYQVRPLGVPAATAAFDEIVASPAVQLFADRARFARAGFAMTEENASIVSAICRSLDGLPLAIELAAPRVKLMSPGAIRDRLNDQLGLLSSSADGLPARQQTMRASIEWSVRFLTETQQRLFAILSVFHGSFGLEAVESVAVSFGTWTSLFDDLEALIDNNLLTAIESENGEVRFRFLQPIVEYARSILEKSDDRRSARQAHAGYFVRLAEVCEADRVRIGALNDDWGRRLAVEDDNFREAIRFLTESASDSALELAVNLHLWWMRVGRFAEARRIVESVLTKLPDADARARGYAHKAAAMIAWKQGDYSNAAEHYERCLELAVQIDDQRLRSMAVNGVGTVSYLTGNTARAKVLLTELLPESRRSGGVNLTDSIIINLTEIARVEGDYETAVNYGRETLAGADPSDGLMLCGAYLNLGSSLFCLGETVEASDCYEKAGELADRLSLKAYRMVCLIGRAALAASEGDAESASALVAESDRIGAEIGYELELPDRLFRKRFIDARIGIDAGGDNSRR